MSTAIAFTPKVPFTGKLLYPFARRFIAGTHLDQALNVVEKFNKDGFLTTLDMLGEDIFDPAQARASAEQYVIMIKKLAERSLEKNVSLKLTQMGLDIGKEVCLENVKRIAETAGEFGAFVRIDMEGSPVTSKTLDIVHEIHSKNYPVGTVVQAMLKRTPNDVAKLLEAGIKIRLCKGAYKESADIAYQDKREINRQYEALVKRLLTSGIYHAIATHDDELVNFTREYASRVGISKDNYEFQMLLGIRPSYQKKLKDSGENVRVYIPFGSHWLPYVWRRMRERKENIIFMIRGMLSR